jgi:hypothetical protein
MPIATRRPLRILSTVAGATFGGPQNRAVQLQWATGVTGGLDLTVVLSDEPGDIADRLRAAGIKVLQMPLLGPRGSVARRSPGDPPVAPGRRQDLADPEQRRRLDAAGRPVAAEQAPPTVLPRMPRAACQAASRHARGA